MNSKTVAICDTEPIAIEGMRAILETCEDLRLAAAETSLLGGMEMVRQYGPAVIILDKTFGIHAIMDCLKRLRASGYSHRTNCLGIESERSGGSADPPSRGVGSGAQDSSNGRAAGVHSRGGHWEYLDGSGCPAGAGAIRTRGAL